MRLLLLRHAKSEKAEPGKADEERTLNKRGRGDARAMGGYLERHGLQPDLALVSNAARARATWELVAGELSRQPQVVYEPRLYAAGLDTIIAVVRETKTAVGTLILVGHNPGLHEAARLLIASGDVEARERLNESLPTAGLAVIDFAGRNWRMVHAHGGRLERFVTPRSLAEAENV
jgi:phosphohistidine phosphatase